MFKFLHTADIHISSGFTGDKSSPYGDDLRSCVFKAFSNIIDLAKPVDVLLICGDLFDTPKPDVGAISFVKQKFAEIPDTKVFISAGNHDPYTADSIYANEDLGKNVRVFSTEGECFELPDLKARVFGISFSSAHCKNGLNLPKISKKDGFFDILAIHGETVSGSRIGSYNPITSETVATCNYDYMALGHIHKRSDIKRIGRTSYAYSGAPQGRGFDECGDMGCYLCSVHNGFFDATFKPTAEKRIFKLDIDIDKARGGIVDIIRNTLNATGGKNDLYRITLCGTPDTAVSDIEILKHSLSEFPFIDIIDETKPLRNTEDLAKQDSLCGEFVRIMLSKIESGIEPDKVNTALRLGIEALLGGDE